MKNFNLMNKIFFSRQIALVRKEKLTFRFLRYLDFSCKIAKTCVLHSKLKMSKIRRKIEVMFRVREQPILVIPPKAISFIFETVLRIS